MPLRTKTTALCLAVLAGAENFVRLVSAENVQISLLATMTGINLVVYERQTLVLGGGAAFPSVRELCTR